MRMQGKSLSPLGDDGVPFLLQEIQSPVELGGLLGSTQLSQHTQHIREVSVSQIITHLDSEKLHPFGSGITILQLLFPVNFTSYIIPACLPVPAMKLPSNSSCWIPGWGISRRKVRGCGGVGGDENGEEEEGEKDRRTKKGGVSPPEGSPGKGPLGPLCFISRGLDHSSSSSESV